jgi:hypothetical protein
MQHDFGRLRTYERHIACGIASILTALGIIGFIGKEKGEEAQTIVVHVVGAIKKGEVEVFRGASVGDVCSSAGLRDDSDPSDIDMSKKVVQDEIVVIPIKGKKTVYVCGAVIEPRLVSFDDEISAKKIIESVSVTENADLKSFCRRRKFKNGSIVEIKEKKRSFSKSLQ